MEDIKTKEYVVGIDVGGQTTKIGIVNRRGEIVKQSVISSMFGTGEAGLFEDAVCEAIKSLLAQAGLSAEQIQGVGMGAPDANYYEGTIHDAVNLAWAKGMTVPIASDIEKRINIPVTVTNDANAAAIGEMTYGAARGMKDFIMITLGTGVGSGIVVNGSLVYGHDGFAGELGHTKIIRNGGRQCGCGQCGCLEAYTSAIGIARTAREWLEMSDEPSQLRNLSEITSKDIFVAAENGDKLAVKIFEYTGKLLGESFANFIPFSAPEAIVLFGGLARAWKYIEKPILDAMNSNVVFLWKNKVRLIHSTLPESDAAILGASALAW